MLGGGFIGTVAASLIIVTGEKRKKIFFNSVKTIVGRGAQCDVQLDDETVTGASFAIILTKSHYALKRLAPDGGMAVNGMAVRQALLRLKTGDVISVGRTKVLFSNLVVGETTSGGGAAVPKSGICEACQGLIPEGQPYTSRIATLGDGEEGVGINLRFLCGCCIGLLDRAGLLMKMNDAKNPFSVRLSEIRILQHWHIVGRTIERDSLRWNERVEALNRVLRSRKPRVTVVSASKYVLEVLQRNPHALFGLTSDQFEEFACDRMDAAGYNVRRVGSAYTRDGGVDIVGWPKASSVFPHLLAIQVKHHRSPDIRTPAGPVKELRDVVSYGKFQAGLLVTNSTFTPDARAWAALAPHIVRLRDFEDLKRWIEDNFLCDEEWREVPSEVVLPSGIIIPIPRSRQDQVG